MLWENKWRKRLKSLNSFIYSEKQIQYWPQVWVKKDWIITFECHHSQVRLFKKSMKLACCGKKSITVKIICKTGIVDVHRNPMHTRMSVWFGVKNISCWKTIGKVSISSHEKTPLNTSPNSLLKTVSSCLSSMTMHVEMKLLGSCNKT